MRQKGDGSEWFGRWGGAEMIRRKGNYNQVILCEGGGYFQKQGEKEI